MKTYFSLLTVLLLCACSSEAKVKTAKAISDQAVQITAAVLRNAEILKGFKVLVNQFELNAEKESSFMTEKGSKINIPAKAFRYQNGKPVEGKVKLTFQEYHTPGEIMASGIPMVYETPGGEKQQFESAGMFDIRAFQNGEELELADGKKIDIELATANKGTFNFYAFEDDKMNWKLKDTDCKPFANPEIAKQAEELKKIEENPAQKPKKPIAYKPSDKLFDIFVNLQKHPEFAAVNGVMCKYTGTDAKADPGNNPKVFDKSYELVSMYPLEGEALDYDLAFVKGKDTLNVQAAPVFQGKLMTRKEKEFAAKMQAFNEQLVKADKLKKQAKRETELLRKFAIDKMGIYNCDRQFKDADAIPLLASFDFGGKIKPEDEAYVNVFLVPSKKNVVIRYDQESFSAFAINPKENNRMVAILPDNTVFMLSDKDIRSLNINPGSNGKKVTFKMKPYPNKVTAPQKLDEILASL